MTEKMALKAGQNVQLVKIGRSAVLTITWQEFSMRQQERLLELELAKASEL